MSVYLPKKLPTTMGIELSYMPEFLEDLHQRIGADGFKVWGSADYVYGPFCNAMEHQLNKFKIKVYKCSTDPGCVEVPTMPYKTANALRTAVRKINSVARRVGLSPVSSYSIGGGAHIHTGMLGDTTKEKTIYSVLMHTFQARNPWFAWAFAGLNDFSNAQTFTCDDLMRSREEVTPERLERRIKNTLREIASYQANIVETEKRLHESDVWGRQDSWTFADVKGDVRMYVRALQQERKELILHRRKLAALLEKPTGDTLVNYSKITTDFPKQNVVVNRGKTMEFRCFRMPATNKGMDYLVAVACGVVQQCRDEMRLMVELGVDEVDTRGMRTLEELRTMKYSEAKAGFNSMLRSLDLEPSDYREYCVNIALRMRHRRTCGTSRA